MVTVVILDTNSNILKKFKILNDVSYKNIFMVMMAVLDTNSNIFKKFKIKNGFLYKKIYSGGHIGYKF